MAKNVYLSKQQLEQEIIASKAIKKTNPDWTVAQCFTPKLTEYLLILVNRYANKGQWRGYSYIDEMKADAMLTLCQNIFKYDETRFNNPFGYATQIVKYCFITFLEKEEMVRDIKDSLWEAQGMTPSFARQVKNEILSNAREAALDRAKDQDTKEVKTIKSLKKDVEALNEKINRLSLLVKVKESNMEADFEIAEILEIAAIPYTGDRESALELFPERPLFEIEELEIAGQQVTCLTLRDASTRSNTKRVIQNTDEETITTALCSIALTIRRDLLVKELRAISGYNVTSTHIPTADKIIVSAENSDYEPQDSQGGDITPSAKRKFRKKV